MTSICVGKFQTDPMQNIEAGRLLEGWELIRGGRAY